MQKRHTSFKICRSFEKLSLRVQPYISRFFNALTDPKKYWWLILINVALAFFEICNHIGPNDSVYVRISVIACVEIIALSDMILHSPKAFSLSCGALFFDEYDRIRPQKSAFVISLGKFWWLKISYTVTEIKNVEFHQNAFEKLFNVGRISFCGKATYTAKRDTDSIKEKYAFTIYGISNFSIFKSKFLNCL